mmetsp:Transcript_8064/g.13419  ORF Transcript_8064/g.13419 Transcript_8064/m.13419 type:complete len:230 (-) Transcript_8064:50-739(-)
MNDFNFLQQQQTLLADRSVVYQMRVNGQDSQCGVVLCCPGEAMQISFNKHQLPAELQGRLDMHEVSQFVDAAQKVLNLTVMPMFPCIFTHFCIPFSPVCALYYCQGERQKRLRQIVDEHNAIIAFKGYYWEYCGGSKLQHLFPLFVLKTTNENNMLPPAAPGGTGVQLNIQRGGVVPGGEQIVPAAATIVPTTVVPVAPYPMATTQPAMLDDAPNKKQAYGYSKPIRDF